MDEMPSAEFRRQYAKLTTRTVVTVNGHAIGTWEPVGATVRYMERRFELETAQKPKGSTAQAKRDELLRKINRGK